PNFIPLERLGEYTDAIERINIELSLKNKLTLLEELERYFQGELRLARPEDPELERIAPAELIGDRRKRALECLASVRARWSFLARNLDTSLAQALPRLAALGYQPLLSELERRLEREPGLTVFD